MAGTSVDGLVSGMDTSTIISQLMQLERQPVARLEAQRTKAQNVSSAYQSINGRFSALQTAADKLTKADLWQTRKATSSSSSVAVTASVNALPGSFTFDVEQVAAAQTYVSAGTFSSTAATVTASTSITITKGSGTPVSVAVGSGSLADVVSGINAAGAGVKAAAIQVAPGTFKLQLTSSTTGVESDFTVTDGGNAAPLGALTELVEGKDARLGIGALASPGRYTITSASNTFADVVPGVTVTAAAVATNVTIEVVPDVKAVADAVESMVTAANAVLSEIKTRTSYNPSTKQGAILVGDSVVRQLQQDVLRLTSSLSGDASAASAGIQLSRDGTLQFTRSKFEATFNADPAAAAGLFRPGGSLEHADPAYAELEGTITFLSTDDRTKPGSYDVKVTAAATQARVRVTGTAADGDQLTITVPGATPLVVTAGPADDLQALAVKINTAATTASLGVVATVESGELQVRTLGYGSQPTLSIAATGGLAADPVVAGVDVAGTINGVAATGVGQVLSAPAEDPTLFGLALLVKATPAQVATAAGQAGASANLFGSFTYRMGLAQRLDSLAGDAVRTGTGRLTAAIAGRAQLAESLSDQIDAWDTRLELREAQLRRTYSNLEVALGKLRDQSNWLAGQLGGLASSGGSS